MKIKLIYILAVILSITFFSCKDKIIVEPDPLMLSPNRFYYLITQDGEKLPDSTLAVLQFYYFNNNGNKITSDSGRSTGGAALHVAQPSWIAGNEQLDTAGVRLCMTINSFGIEHNTWYFEYPGGDVDTLYVEDKEISKKEGRENECTCTHPFSVVRFNGRDAYKHPTLKATDGKPVWVLEK